MVSIPSYSTHLTSQHRWTQSSEWQGWRSLFQDSSRALASSLDGGYCCRA
ncbi:hypothetical protein SLEP1_g33260 [Rubroshorea leprosula]|uniref:Uncharacterized protein n=1 Tax=Rubroshorea leprosula TaxID=152421 RepID=A0AAV5KG23_9ROSI|nr:hypothetical protein SLEP1_g33260 [Rubroshorea leprosula]